MIKLLTVDQHQGIIKAAKANIEQCEKEISLITSQILETNSKKEIRNLDKQVALLKKNIKGYNRIVFNNEKAIRQITSLENR